MAGAPAPTDLSTAPHAAPGPVSVAAVREWISAIDVARLSDRERLDLVAGLERIKHTAAATQARATHALRESREVARPQDAVRSVGSEVALARRESPTRGDRFVGLARALVDEMPFTMQALDSGACSERHAEVMVQVTSILTLEHRGEVDRRVGPLLGRLGVRGAEGAARRVAHELDVAAVVRRHADAVRSRRVTSRPAPDGMAYLTVLGPMVEVVGAAAALRRHAQSVVSGQRAQEGSHEGAQEGAQGRGLRAIEADTALQLLSGRAAGQVQPVEVHLVMTDRALLGTGDPDRSVMEPARVPGHGSLPAPITRAWVRDDPGGGSSGSSGEVAEGATVDRAATVWLRRLYTSPDGRNLVAMDSRRRHFTGLLRRMLVLRDDVCRTPWCEAPIAHADHTVPARDEGATSYMQGGGRCARCNYGKEAPGWAATVLTADEIRITTPLGHSYSSRPPPLLGWGSAPSPASSPVSAASLATSPASAPPQASPVSAPSPSPAPDSAPSPSPDSAPSRSATSAPRRSHRPVPAHRDPDRARRRVLSRTGVRLHRFHGTRHLERTLNRYLR